MPQSSLVFRDVSYTRRTSLHFRSSVGNSEVRGNMKAFVRTFVGSGGSEEDVDSRLLLNGVDVQFPKQGLCGVVGTSPGSVEALLLAAGGRLRIDTGSIERPPGLVVSLDQIMAIRSPYYSCRENLRFLADLVRMDRDRVERGIAQIERISDHKAALDMSLRRVPAWVFRDFGIVFFCEARPDLLVAPEVSLAVGPVVQEYWEDWLLAAEDRDGLVLIGSTRPAEVLDRCGDVLLMDGPETLMLGSVDEVEEEYPEILHEALRAVGRRRQDDLSLYEEDDDDDEESDELDGAMGAGVDPVLINADAENSGTRSGPQFVQREMSRIVIDGDGATALLYPDGAPVRLQAEHRAMAPIVEHIPLCGTLPVVFREEGARVRIVVEVLSSSVWVRAGINLNRNKVRLLTAEADEQVFVESPRTVTFEVTIPPHVLRHMLYFLTAYAVVTDERQGVWSSSRAMNFVTFINASKEDPEGVMCDRSNNEAYAYFENPASVVDVRSVSPDADFLLRELWLEDSNGELLNRSLDTYRLPDPQVAGCRVVCEVAVFKECDFELLVAISRPAIGEIAALLYLPTVAHRLEMGIHQLRVDLPMDQLGDGGYRVRVDLGLRGGAPNHVAIPIVAYAAPDADIPRREYGRRRQHRLTSGFMRVAWPWAVARLADEESGSPPDMESSGGRGELK